MDGRNFSRLTAKMFLKMLHEEQDEEDEDPTLGLDSRSEISDAVDLYYTAQKN